MKRFTKPKLSLVAILVLALITLLSLTALAQVGGGFDLSWNVVAGGGGNNSSNGALTLGGTISQPGAGSVSGGSYTLDGGFWGGVYSNSTPVPNLVGYVIWQGRPTQPNALQQLPITLTLKLGGTEVNYTTLSTDASGFVTASVAGLPNGTYTWRVKNPKYLTNSGTVSITGASVTQAEMGLLRAGDCNNDNVVNVSDFNILKGTFGKASGDPGYDDRADFTGDVLVSVSDFNLLKGNFGLSGSPPTGPGSR